VRRRLASYSGIALTLLVVWYFLLYLPLGKELAGVRVRAEQAKQQIAEFRRIMAQLPVYLETHRSLERNRTDLNEALYAKDDILELFNLISNRAQALNLKVIEITPPVEELLLLNNLMPHPDKPPFLNLTVRLRGGYINFGNYVAFIESAQFFRGVNRCQITTSPDQAGPTDYIIGFQALLGQIEETS
jgi:hypothetical protein